MNPSPPFHRPFVLIVSAGRTGTRFFGKTLQQWIPAATSAHEPDLLVGDLPGIIRLIRQFGFHHMVTGRILGTTGIRALSERYLSGKVDLATAVIKLQQQRDRFIRETPGELLIESYWGWYGLLPAIPQLFEQYRVAAIVRDPRQWVRSWMNRGGWYDQNDYPYRFFRSRIDPFQINDTDGMRLWPQLDTFGRLCWAWKTINSVMIRDAEQLAGMQVFKFEDLFGDQDQVIHMRGFLEFITEFPGHPFEFHLPENAVEQRINASEGNAFPDWPQWSDAQIAQIQHFCGPLMAQWGYGLEDGWRQRLSALV